MSYMLHEDYFSSSSSAINNVYTIEMFLKVWSSDQSIIITWRVKVVNSRFILERAEYELHNYQGPEILILTKV